MTTYEIHYANGRIAPGYASHDAAIAAVVQLYPDAICGHVGDLADPDPIVCRDPNARTLCWVDAYAYDDDCGYIIPQHATAVIRRDRRTTLKLEFPNNYDFGRE